MCHSHQIIINSRNFAIRLEGSIRQGLLALAVSDAKRIGGAAKLLVSNLLRHGLTWECTQSDSDAEGTRRENHTDVMGTESIRKVDIC